MNSKLNEYSEEESRMYNGQTVMAVLSNLGNAATFDKITDEISHMINQPKEVIEPEVKRILRRGISNGFLERFGKRYLLSGEQATVEVDSKRKSYKNIGKRNNRKSNMKSFGKAADQAERDLNVNSNFEFEFLETDNKSKDDQLLLVNPEAVVAGIITDLFKVVNTSGQNNDEENDGLDNVIDLEAILSKNLNAFTVPFDEVIDME